MSEEELDELCRHCPTLYHMAEQGSWESIRANGLLSTSALLDRYGITGDQRDSVESRRRSTSVHLHHPELGSAVVRDQLPMDDSGLIRCLDKGLQPSDWYRVLNRKVFFWLTRDRLVRLLSAGTYRAQEHDVLELQTRPLVEAYRGNVWLCPMNSGCTKPFPHRRGHGTFRRIPDYPYEDWCAKRSRGERVVELAVDYAVPDVEKFVTRAVRMRAGKQLGVIFEA